MPMPAFEWDVLTFLVPSPRSNPFQCELDNSEGLSPRPPSLSVNSVLLNHTFAITFLSNSVIYPLFICYFDHNRFPTPFKPFNHPTSSFIQDKSHLIN
ncbi:hypothetical protein PGT21_008029 [Puccinia graminis f. sp. tritici]|uniref:Uncharacterized protein n=1 Tax=Puccinia graminis f. sp. tritici TaxID=56615 RepID=A0A5B0LR96_PUCGR|nr:hypothetical protein PGT21_008029 [Puccinia graminis f. sp. tritici]KAA1069882.1 hypothetical protein PGTUg99_001558 [Puccinia graminis f. sp. tritici]KAA1123889.1 hypothetical protein PGTUg99_028624 [Puccinia graminis f. sp. tritici]KAA1137707.1 hypothetical protein PGTUg99_001506 [Puccinia graminis f. sp. tritici]